MNFFCRVFGHKWELYEYRRRYNVNSNLTMEQVKLRKRCKRCGINTYVPCREMQEIGWDPAIRFKHKE